MSGQGQMMYNNGAVYLGNWLNGKRSGQGKMTVANDVYEGHWANDLPNGPGQRTFTNGNVYVGNLANGKMNGQGQMTFSNG